VHRRFLQRHNNSNIILASVVNGTLVRQTKRRIDENLGKKISNTVLSASSDDRNVLRYTAAHANSYIIIIILCNAYNNVIVSRRLNYLNFFLFRAPDWEGFRRRSIREKHNPDNIKWTHYIITLITLIQYHIIILQYHVHGDNKIIMYNMHNNYC